MRDLPPPAPLALCSGSVDATRAIAEAMADLARGGDLLLLIGDLGAGKTAFTQGFARGLGVTEAVTSPTFTLVHDHPGRLVLHHVDVYRLERTVELVDLGLNELLDDGGVTLVEWGDAVVAALPTDHLDVRFNFGEGDDERTITLAAKGPRWAARWAAVAAVVAPWREGGG